MTPEPPTIDVYWRRGCGYCASLRVALGAAQVPVTWHDIWADPDAAAYVRSVANGNETVPTVRYGDTVAVNPRPSTLLEDLERRHPGLVHPSGGWSQVRDGLRALVTRPGPSADPSSSTPAP